jgi:hypothetical protein
MVCGSVVVCSLGKLLGVQLGYDAVHELPDCHDALGFVVADPDAQFVFDLDNDLDWCQGVNVIHSQVLDESIRGTGPGHVEAQNLADDPANRCGCFAPIREVRRAKLIVGEWRTLGHTPLNTASLDSFEEPYRGDQSGKDEAAEQECDSVSHFGRKFWNLKQRPWATAYMITSGVVASGKSG